MRPVTLPRIAVVVLLWTVLFRAFPTRTGPAASRPQSFSYPAPRYPDIPKVGTVEELLANARHIITRKKPYTGNQFPGYGIRGGEKVVFVVHSYTDPWAIEAFRRAFREKNCRVDVVILQGPEEVWDSTLPMELAVRGKTDKVAWDRQAMLDLEDYAAKQKYDLMVSPAYLNSTWVNAVRTGSTYDYEFHWPTRELLADPAVQYPYEIIEAIDRKAWEVIRQADEVHLTDPEGTDLRFSYPKEQWEVLEGTHPKYLDTGRRRRPGASEIPQISSHLMAVPTQIFDGSDARGVIAGTIDHSGPYPYVKVTLEKSRVTKLEGGGYFGDLWREYLASAKDVRYPHYPGPGVGWLVEGSIGAHPKIWRPFNAFESVAARSAWTHDRNRSGVMHLGIGTRDDTSWAVERGLPVAHFHVHLYFLTYTARLRDGRTVNVVDKGHLAALDDPAVKAVAAKYGNAEELLREVWIPALPGINCEGDYWKDYAPDPAAWLKREDRRAYGKLLDQRLYP
ncbi:MAG: hypothetical protein HY652_00150 [Acidobacteria bacterium]|nr:hypothetical protein [Acidobacteriota bacterium]